MRVDELRQALDEAAGAPVASAPAYRSVVRRGQRSRRRRMVAVALVATAAVMPAGILWLVSDHDQTEPQRVAAGPGRTASPFTTAAAPQTTHGTIPPAAAEAHAALDAWRSFPVTASPRPLIVDELVNAPERGFPSNATKEAFDSGRFRLATALPNGPVTAGGYPLITGQPIVDRLKTASSPGPVATSELTVTSVRLGAASFRSDRGAELLPAWLITFAGITDPAQVLAVAPSALFTPPSGVGGFSPNLGVTLVGDRTLIVTYGGAGSGQGPCDADYALDVYPSDHAIAIEVRQVARPPATITTGPVACAAIAVSRRLKVTLDSPLGARAVIDANTGAPVGFSS